MTIPMIAMDASSTNAIEYEIFVPGRICLFGEHSDWAGMYRRPSSACASNHQVEDIPTGLCLIAGTNQGLFAKVRAHPDKLVLTCTLNHSCNDVGVGSGAHVHTNTNITNTNNHHHHHHHHNSNNDANETSKLELDINDLLSEATSTSLFSYIAGVAYQIRTVYPSVGGIVMNNYKTTLPVKKGLSSSAAICVLTARAYSQCYGLNFTKRQEMEFAYLGETTTPSKCGRMDQGCAYGAGKPIVMEFNGNDLHVVEDIILGAPIHLLMVDLASVKNTPAILRDLQMAYPIPTTDIHRGVHQLLGPINHDIMKRALAALQQGNPKAVGELMTLAQDQFDTYAMPASPTHLTSPVLHKVLQHPALQPHVYGGKGVGSQGDGSAQFIAKSQKDQLRAIDIIEKDFGMHCLPLTLGQ